MRMSTSVVVSKASAQPNDIIEVEWFIGADVRWDPNADDELRLTTGTGVLVARCPFVNAYTDTCKDPYKIDLTHAKGLLVCPPVPGGYVIALYDRLANRRVFTMPYRIEGPVFNPPSVLSLEFPHTIVRNRTGGRSSIPITPLGRVTVSFPPSIFQQYSHHTNHVLGIIAPHKGDNDGGQARGLYEGFDRIVKVPHAFVPHATSSVVDLEEAAAAFASGAGGPKKGKGKGRGGGGGGGGGTFDSSDDDTPLPSTRKGYYSHSFHYNPPSTATGGGGNSVGGRGANIPTATTPSLVGNNSFGTNYDWGEGFGNMVSLTKGGGGGAPRESVSPQLIPMSKKEDDSYGDLFNNTVTGTGRTAKAYASIGNANDGGIGGGGRSPGGSAPLSPSSWLFRGRDSLAVSGGGDTTARYNNSNSGAYGGGESVGSPSANQRGNSRRGSLQVATSIGQLMPANNGEDDVTMSLILPTEPGPYQVRYVTTPPSGVPFTVAVSEVFYVERPQGTMGDAATAADWQLCDIVGEVKCLDVRTSVCVNERVRVAFDIKSNSGRKLTPLDAIVFYPFGRSEQIEHHDGVFNAIGEALYAGVLEIPAPPSEGYYQIGYYSFIAQHVVAVGEVAVSVRLPVAKLLLSSGLTEGTKATSKPVYQVDLGDAVSFAFEIEDHVFSKQDQIIVLDDIANKVVTAAIQTLELSEQRRHTGGKRSELVRLVVGTAEVTIPMPGKYSVHYYSKARQCPIAQLQAYIQLRPAVGGVPLPFATIRAVGVLPMSEPIAVGVMREGHDGRVAEEAAQDCIVVYDEQQRDCVAAPSPDHPSSFPGIYVHYLRGNSYSQFNIPSLLAILEARQSGFTSGNVPYSTEGRRVVLRYMASLPGHFARVCTSEAIVTLRDPATMLGFVRQQLKYVAMHDLALSSHRFSADGRIAAPIAEPVRGLLTKGPGGERHILVAGEVGSIAKAAAEFGRRAQSNPASTHASHHQGASNNQLTTQGSAMAGMFLNFQTDGATEFRGAVMGPREATTSEAIRIVYHITSGVPRASDRLILFSRDGRRTISDTLLEYALVCRDGILGSDNVGGLGGLRALAIAAEGEGVKTMGELWLNPPTAEGTYVAGYFSDRHQSVVLVSDPFMVSASSEPYVTHGLRGYDALSAHRSRTEAQREREREATQQQSALALGYSMSSTMGGGGGGGGGMGTRPLASLPSSPTRDAVVVGDDNAFASPEGRSRRRSRVLLDDSIGGPGAGGGGHSILERFRVVAASNQNNANAQSSSSNSAMRGLQQPTRAPQTRVLSVGVGSIHLDKELKGPLNDLELFSEAATEFFFGGLRSVAEEQMIILSEGRDNGPESIPTAHNIRQGIRWLTTGAIEGDHLVFYYTGCGTVIDGDNAIVPCNFDVTSRHISYKELHTTLLAAVPRGCNVSVFIDACYWGSLRDAAVQSQLALPDSVAANAIRRRRNAVGIAPEAPWRALAVRAGSPGVIHPLVTEVSLGTLDAYGYFLPERFNPIVSINATNSNAPSRLQSQHSFTSDVFTRSAATVLNGGVASVGEVKHRIILEASSGSYYYPEGAWDAFNRFTGRTVGVFTCSLCQVLKELAPKAREVRWWEVHERIVREVAKSPYPQVPRVIVQAAESLDRLVHTAQ